MTTLPLSAAATSVPVPPWWGVALSMLLVGSTAYVVFRDRLGLTRDLLEAVVRCGVQLLVVGAALVWLFDHAGIPGSLGWVAGMVLLAGVTVGRRAAGLPHAVAVATAGIAVGTASSLALLFGAHVLTARPAVLLPLGGIIVNACMQGMVVLARVRDEAVSSRALIEARLALGLPGRAAFAPHERLALRAALAPVIDSTKVVGLITLPGAMTGLIIAGVSPSVAVRYQIVVMYAWLGSATIAALVSTRLAGQLLFDDAHRLRPVAVPSGKMAR